MFTPQDIINRFVNFDWSTLMGNPDPDLQLAIRQASLPGLSLSQRCESLLESIRAPDLLQHQINIPNDYNETDQKLHMLQQFQNSPEYQIFKNIVDDTLRTLDQITNSAHNSLWRSNDFQVLNSRLWQPAGVGLRNHYGHFLVDLYQQAAPDARRLHRMHTFARQHPSLVPADSALNARACIATLAKGVNLCSQGIVQNFEEAVKSVQQLVFTPSLPERVEALRIQTVRNVIAETIVEQPVYSSELDGNEIHIVAAWQNSFSQEFHLPVIVDQYAATRYTNHPELQSRLRNRLPDVQTESALAMAQAEEIIEYAQALWQKAQSAGASNFTRSCTSLIEQMTTKHGDLDPYTWIDMDDDGMPQGLQTDPNLLAVHILKKIQATNTVHALPETPVEWSPQVQNDDTRLSFNSQGHLTWIEVKTAAGGESELFPVSAKHLSPDQLQELFIALTIPPPEGLLPRVILHDVLRHDWGEALPVCKTQKFDVHSPAEEYVNLAMGIAHGLKLGGNDLQSEFKKFMLSTLHILKSSSFLKLYSEDQVFQLLEFTREWNETETGAVDPIRIGLQLRVLTNLERPDIRVPMYRAALRHSWKHCFPIAQQQSRNYPALFDEDPTYGKAYIDVLQNSAPGELSRVFHDHVQFMKAPELAVQFLNSGIELERQSPGKEGTLYRLMQNTDDQFLLTVLKELVQQGVCIQDWCHPEIVNQFKAKGLNGTATYLHANIKPNPNIGSNSNFQARNLL